MWNTVESLHFHGAAAFEGNVEGLDYRCGNRFWDSQAVGQFSADRKDCALKVPERGPVVWILFQNGINPLLQTIWNLLTLFGEMIQKCSEASVHSHAPG